MINVRYEHHRCPWGPEVYAICDDIYDGADDRPIAGMGSTEAEALADLNEKLDDMTCPWCKSGPGEKHSIHCELEHG